MTLIVIDKLFGLKFTLLPDVYKSRFPLTLCFFHYKLDANSIIKMRGGM